MFPRARAHRVLWVTLIVGCGAPTPDEVAPSDGGSLDAGAAADGSPDAEVGAACGSGTASEIAATPRPHRDLEQLAIWLGGGLTADEKLYEHLVRDVAAIKALEPTLASVTYMAANDGMTLYLRAPTAVAAEMNGGGYVAWDCLNQHYGKVGQTLLGETAEEPYVLVFLKGIYDLAVVAGDYGGLPGVTWSGTSVLAGDGSTLCARDLGGGALEWHVDEGSGDCSAGCIGHRHSCFEVSAAGVATRTAIAGPGEALPACAAAIGLCRPPG